MTRLWIVHREDRERAALVRLAAVPDAVVGPPGDPRFGSEAPAEVVLLGLSGDWETELEFAHRQRTRLAGARWVLVGDAADAEAASAHFDRLPIAFVPYPPDPGALRRLIGAKRGPKGPTLSQRAQRETVSARFTCWLGELQLPEVLRALDPRLVTVPLLVRGEPGTGRETAIRYTHHFGGTSDGRLLHVPCDAQTDLGDIERVLAAQGREQPQLPSVAMWLDEPGRMSARAQRELAAWLEAGPPAGVRAPVLRWLASVDERAPDLDQDLDRALRTLELRLPPLRERTGEIEAIAAGIAHGWSVSRSAPGRSFGSDALAVLEEYPWPGNLRELEAVVERTLALNPSDPISAGDLQLDGALAPIDAARFGTLLADDEELDEPLAETVPETEAAADRHAESAGASAVGAGPWVPRPFAPTTPELPVPAAPSPDAAEAGAALRRIAATLSDQVRNPLATIRSFAELVPKHFEDPDFRARFAEMVRDDFSRIDGVLSRLDAVATLDSPQAVKVDIPALLEDLLDERREQFRRRQLLVLKELDTRQPLALGDPAQLRLALGALLDKMIEVTAPRDDLYLAARRHDGAGDPCLRVLLRFHDPTTGGGESDQALERSIERLVAELVVRAQGGTFAVGTGDADERVLVVDLPAI